MGQTGNIPKTEKYVKHQPVLRANQSISDDAKADRTGDSTGACSDMTATVWYSHNMRKPIPASFEFTLAAMKQSQWVHKTSAE